MYSPFCKVALEALNTIKTDCARGITLDLKSFDSVRQAAAETKKTLSHIDICILNAGIMLVPVELIDGIESEQYVNHFSHFLLLAQLYPLLQAAPGRPRVVSLSSAAHAAGDGNVSISITHGACSLFFFISRITGNDTNQLRHTRNSVKTRARHLCRMAIRSLPMCFT